MVERGGESVLIRNATPDGTLRFDLPRISVAFQTHFGTRSIAHHGSLSTVLISAEARTVSMVWQGALKVPVVHTEYLDFTRVTEWRFL